MDGRSLLLLILFLPCSTLAIRCYRTNNLFFSEDIHRRLNVSIEHSNLIIDKCALIVYFLDIAKCNFFMTMNIYAGEEIKGYFNMDELKEMQRAEEKKKLKQKKMKINAMEATLEMNITTRVVENGTLTTAGIGGKQRRRRSATEALENITLTTDATDALTNSEQQNESVMTTRSSQTSSERLENNTTSGMLETAVSTTSSVEMNTSTTSELKVTSTSIQNITAETTTKDSSVETTTKDAIEAHYREKLLEEIELCLTAVGIFGSANEGPEACIQEAKDRIKIDKERAKLFKAFSSPCKDYPPFAFDLCIQTAIQGVENRLRMMYEKTTTTTLETTPAGRQNLKEAETTVEPIKDDGSPEIEGELSTRLPVVFVCEEDLCNENLRFTEERMGNELDMDKYRCIEEFKDAFWDQYKKEIMELTGKNETQLEEDEELEVNTTSRASTTGYVPPRKDVPKPISSDLIFGIVLVVLLVGHCVHCVYKMKTNRKKDDHIP